MEFYFDLAIHWVSGSIMGEDGKANCMNRSKKNEVFSYMPCKKNVVNLDGIWMSLTYKSNGQGLLKHLSHWIPLNLFVAMCHEDHIQWIEGKNGTWYVSGCVDLGSWVVLSG